MARGRRRRRVPPRCGQRGRGDAPAHLDRRQPADAWSDRRRRHRRRHHRRPRVGTTRPAGPARVPDPLRVGGDRGTAAHRLVVRWDRAHGASSARPGVRRPAQSPALDGEDRAVPAPRTRPPPRCAAGDARRSESEVRGRQGWRRRRSRSRWCVRRSEHRRVVRRLRAARRRNRARRGRTAPRRAPLQGAALGGRRNPEQPCLQARRRPPSPGRAGGRSAS